MTPIQRVATISGIVFLAVSALGFAAGAGGHPMMNMSTGMLLGLFPVNVLHNIVHMLFGVWGISAGWSARRSVVYALGSGAAYLVLAVVLAGAGFWAMWFAPAAASNTQRATQPRAAA